MELDAHRISSVYCRHPSRTMPFDELREGLLFMARKARFFEHLHEAGEARRKAFQLLRPDRNELPGYEPPNAMTRFQSESN